MVPVQFPGFLGTDTGGQAQGDIGVHPRALGNGQQRGRLLEGEALARPPRLSLRRVNECGDVPPYAVPRLGVPDRAGQRVVPHGDGGAGVLLRHDGQRLLHIPGGQFA